MNCCHKVPLFFFHGNVCLNSFRGNKYKNKVSTGLWSTEHVLKFLFNFHHYTESEYSEWMSERMNYSINGKIYADAVSSRVM
jgi:hypothetical protein